MQWFFERISTKSLPIEFGITEQTTYPENFAKLVEMKVITHSRNNLDNIPCALCDENHDCQVRDKDNALFYVCDNGGGRKELTSEDVAIFEYDNLTFLKLMTEELGIKPYHGSPRDEAVYSNDTFFRLGTYQNDKIKVEVFYLRNSDNFEPSLYFGEMGNQPKMLITNTVRADIIFGKENLSYGILIEMLSSAKKKLFDKKKFEQCFDKIHRVRFDKDGNLFLDEKRIYTAPLGGPEFHFLSHLWKNWEKQLTYDAIHTFVKNETGKDTSDPAQKFCQKIKSKIKTTCPKIDSIITIPTVGHYMMADPL